MNTPTATEIAWTAGLYEGEGSITVRNGGVRLSIQMTDEDVIRRLHDIWSGNIGGPYQGRPNAKPIWQWGVNNWFDAEHVANLILPLLHSRRRSQIHEALEVERRPKRPRRVRGFDYCSLPAEPSIAGYLRHRRLGTEPCPRCMESYRLHTRERTREIKEGRVVRIRVAGCPTEITASDKGYKRHKGRGEEACAICKASAALYARVQRQNRATSKP